MKPPWNKGKKLPHSKEWEEKRLTAVRVSSKNKIHPKGYKRSGKLNGDKSPNRKGGITKNMCAWRNAHRDQLTQHRITVLERDGYKCKECGSDKNLCVHHIVAVAEFPQFAFLRMNGVTLCSSCHYKTENFGGAVGRMKQIGGYKFVILSIPSKFHDYPTVGNYGEGTDGSVLIFVSEMPDERHEQLVAVHEFVEICLLRHRGIALSDTDKFDIEFENERVAGLHTEDDEPGDDPRSPYFREHRIAENIERILAVALGVDWRDYSQNVNKLD